MIQKIRSCDLCGKKDEVFGDGEIFYSWHKLIFPVGNDLEFCSEDCLIGFIHYTLESGRGVESSLDSQPVESVLTPTAESSKPALADELREAAVTPFLWHLKSGPSPISLLLNPAHEGGFKLQGQATPG